MSFYNADIPRTNECNNCGDFNQWMYDAIKDYAIFVNSKHFQWAFSVFFAWCAGLFIVSANVIYEGAL